MPYFAIGIASILLYLLATFMQWRCRLLSMHRQAGEARRINHRFLWVAALAVVLHGAQLIWLWQVGRFSFDFFHLLSLVAFSVSATLLIMSLRLPLRILCLIAFPLTVLAQVVAMAIPAPVSMNPPNPGIALHIVLSLLAYALVVLANLQAALLIWQNHTLKHDPGSRLLGPIAPLQATERALLELTGIGLAALSLGIMSGILFLENLFAQGLVHKTVLTLAAWLLFALLLAGHHYWGWRGLLAARLTLIGSTLLTLGFLGSRFVIDIVLQGGSGT